MSTVSKSSHSNILNLLVLHCTVMNIFTATNEF